MIVAVDVYYDDHAGTGRAGAVVFGTWESNDPIATVGSQHRGIAAYVPGEFYKRELPCILPLLRHCRERWSVEAILVDGFVDLAPNRPGLGRHLFDALSDGVEVVGVSKNAFTGTPGKRVTRGASTRPLWVTSTADINVAAERVMRMAGNHRIPDLLKLVDSVSKGHTRPDTELGENDTPLHV